MTSRRRAGAYVCAGHHRRMHHVAPPLKVTAIRGIYATVGMGRLRNASWYLKVVLPDVEDESGSNVPRPEGNL